MANESVPRLEWLTVDFSPAPIIARKVVRKRDNALRERDELVTWKCLYLTGMHNTPFLDVAMAGWLKQQCGDKTRIIAAVTTSNGEIVPWDEIRPKNNVHTTRACWCVVWGPLPSKHSARQRWQELQGAIILEQNQRDEEES